MNPPTSNLLTNSRLVSFQRCARAHDHRYERGITPTSSAPALVFGTAVHASLEAFWRAWQRGGFGATEQALDALNEHALDDETLVRARVMVGAYCTRYTGFAARCTVLEVEREFRAPIVNPDTGVAVPGWELAGKIDAIVRLADGRVALVEHKTAGRDVSAGSDYRTRLTLDAQIGIYFDGAEALGYRPELCLYDVLVKPSLDRYLATPEPARRFKKDGTLYANQRAEDESLDAFAERLFAAIEANPDRYLVQAEIHRTDAEREACRRDVLATARAIELTRRARYAPRSAQACFAHGRCDYLTACLAPGEINNPHVYRRLPVLHPELGTHHEGLTETTA